MNDSVAFYFMHRKAWQSLGDMSQEEARHGLISLLDAATPRLREFALEQWKSKKASEQRENRYAGDCFRGVEELTLLSITVIFLVYYRKMNIEETDHLKNHQDGIKDEVITVATSMI